MDDEIVSLAECVAGLRAQLELAVRRQREAVESGVEQYVPPLHVGEIVVELEMLVGRDDKLGGKLNYWIVTAEAERKMARSARQKVTLKLVPDPANPLTLGDDTGVNIT